MPDIPVLETDRLLLRGWRVDDIQPGNAASVRVAEKLGMRRRERTEVGGHSADVYALTRDRR